MGGYLSKLKSKFHLSKKAKPQPGSSTGQAPASNGANNTNCGSHGDATNGQLRIETNRPEPSSPIASTYNYLSPNDLPSSRAGGLRPALSISTQGDSRENLVRTDDFVTVLSPNSKLGSTSLADGTDLGDVRKECPRFRILVIGKANAGKTTILQKTCNTTESPVIIDQDGTELRSSVITPTDGRGIHDINRELTFSSNTTFVFHDSPGFEASSTKEIVAVRDFIDERAAAKNLKDQLHVIWYCLPVDGDRPLQEAEMDFFNRGTGRVPVIAIFTKYDSMILKEYNRLRYEEKRTRAEANEQAPPCAEELFLNSQYYLKRVQNATHPPASSLRVQGMQSAESNCAELSRRTVEALDSKSVGQFRILVIGKVDAGKTTILQKTCITTEAPIVHDEHGNVVDRETTEYRNIGIQGINHELTFPSNSSFIFHDSQGFKAGSKKEIEAVQNFIDQRATADKLKDQLHAIWYCLPTDSDEPLSDPELSFFEKGTGRVPVIAIFTKYDSMIRKEFNRLRNEENYSPAEANKLAPSLADKVFQESDFFLKRLQATPHPPTRFLRVQDMQRPDSNCSELCRQTMDALASRKLQLLFLSGQQNNLGLVTECALKWYIRPAITQSRDNPMGLEDKLTLMKNILLCYGHLLVSKFLGVGEDVSNSAINWGGYVNQSHYHAPILEHFLAGQDFPTLQILKIGIVVLILAEESFHLKNSGPSPNGAFKLAFTRYLTSGRPSAVNQEIHRKYGGVNIQDLVGDEEKFVKSMQKLIGKFMASSS